MARVFAIKLRKGRGNGKFCYAGGRGLGEGGCIGLRSEFGAGLGMGTGEWRLWGRKGGEARLEGGGGRGREDWRLWGCWVETEFEFEGRIGNGGRRLKAAGWIERFGGLDDFF